MIDWSKPIEAIPTGGGAPEFAVVDPSYFRKDNYVPVRLRRNLWTGQSDGYYVGGTWYFTDDGVSIGGLDASGKDNSKFTVRNKSV